MPEIQTLILPICGPYDRKAAASEIRMKRGERIDSNDGGNDGIDRVAPLSEDGGADIGRTLLLGDDCSGQVFGLLHLRRLLMNTWSVWTPNSYHNLLTRLDLLRAQLPNMLSSATCPIMLSARCSPHRSCPTVLTDKSQSCRFAELRAMLALALGIEGEKAKMSTAPTAIHRT